MRTPQTLRTQSLRAQAATQPLGPTPTGPLGGRRVLVVEDVYLLATALQEALQREGGRVVGPFRGADAARQAADAEPLDLAMLDVHLAGDTVFPLAEHLETLGVPVVFVTGCAPDQLPPRWRMRPCVTKPVDVGALCAVAARLLQAPATPTPGYAPTPAHRGKMRTGGLANAVDRGERATPPPPARPRPGASFT
jgi:DNA-binding response OmpR family regulator